MRRWSRIIAVPYGADELVELACDYVDANEEQKAAEAARKKARDKLVSELDPGGTITFEDNYEDGTAWVVQRVDRSTEKVDEDELLRHLTDEQFDLVTKPRLDKDLLAAAIEDGLIDASQVAPFYFEDTVSTIRASKKRTDDSE